MLISSFEQSQLAIFWWEIITTMLLHNGGDGFSYLDLL